MIIIESRKLEQFVANDFCKGIRNWELGIEELTTCHPAGAGQVCE
jgi:hypothetical protein